MIGHVYEWRNALTGEYLATFVVVEWDDRGWHRAVVLDAPSNRRFDVSPVGDSVYVPTRLDSVPGRYKRIA